VYKLGVTQIAVSTLTRSVLWLCITSQLHHRSDAHCVLQDVLMAKLQQLQQELNKLRAFSVQLGQPWTPCCYGFF